MSSLFSSHSYPFSIADLSSSDIALLTQVLSLPSSAGGTLTKRQTGRATTTLIDELPKHLVRPSRYQHQIATFLHKYVSEIPGSTLAPLCTIHSHLNTQLIHSIFTCLALEVGIRLNSLTTYIHLYPEHESFIHSLRQLHALWLDPEVYKRTFQEALPRKWQYEENRCEACMLARVGGDGETVCQLKVALISRLRGHRHKPLLMRWVDGWLKWLDEGMPYLETAERKVAIEDEAKAIRTARKTAHQTRRKKDHHKKSEKDHHGKSDRDHHGKSENGKSENGKSERDHHGKSEKKDHHGKSERDHHGKSEKREHHGKSERDHRGKSENPFDDDKSHYPFDDDKEVKEPKAKKDSEEAPDELPEPTGRDFENSVIDHYGALMSTCHLPEHADGSRWKFSEKPSPEQKGLIPPPLRIRAVPPKYSKEAFRNRVEPKQSPEEEGYVHPAFRNRAEPPIRQASTKPAAKGAATLANEYQGLLSQVEKTEIPRRTHTRRASSKHDKHMTNWGDFFK